MIHLGYTEMSNFLGLNGIHKAKADLASHLISARWPGRGGGVCHGTTF
jgi:hypothetical protein